mgnify:CR=1 FL=1
MSEITSKLSSCGDDVKQIQPEFEQAKNAFTEQKKVTRNFHVS